MLTGCHSYKPKVGHSWNQDLIQGTPAGPNNFKLGWRDGCETGVSANANHFARPFYSFKQNYDLAQDHEYYTGWRIGWTFCHRYVFQFYKRKPF